MASGLAWTRDGMSLVYGDGSWGGIWRIGLAGDSLPERIEVAGLRASRPSTLASKDLLAFRNDRYDADLYTFEERRPRQAVAASSLPDYNPSFSADGRHIAYTSFRSGVRDEIWLAEADGSNPRQVTHGPGLWQGSPRFAPDGRQVVFDSMNEDGHWDIWTIGVDGGSPRRLTLEPGDENMPSFSRDGRFVYYRSKGMRSPDIWRIPAVGGPPERVTRNGGDLAYESTDGRTLYFTKAPPRLSPTHSSSTIADSPLFAMPADGGPERQVVDCVSGVSFAVSPRGLHYVGCSADETESLLYLLEAGTGKPRLLGKLQGVLKRQLIAASPDGRVVLYPRVVVDGAALMLIEDFR
jgi:Tol biopolymer transport system component